MRIDQMLHGYSDGHRLLAASTEVSRTARYIMLGLSDISGRSMVPGFDEYLTGYPVPHSRMYAFAKTWYAPEMERPGCVWTHTLLIEQKDLGIILEPGGLRQLFRRPPAKQTREFLDDYQKPLENASRPTEPTLLPPELAEQAQFVLWYMYAEADAPVFQPSEHSRHFEDLVLAIWDQQWPALRMCFSFCTGAIENRSIEGRPFDFQVAPGASIREVRREVSGALIIGNSTASYPVRNSDWLSIATNDLIGASERPLRRFFREHAVPGFDGRKAYKPLAELFLIGTLSHEESNLTSFFDRIGRRYPEPEMAIELKNAVAGMKRVLSQQMFPETSEADVLRALATMKADNAFNLDLLAVDDRCRALWKEDKEGATRLVSQLIRSDHNANTERILLPVIRGMTVEDAMSLSASIPALVATMLRLNPEAAASTVIWRGHADRQRELFDAATGGRETPDDLQRGIVLSMLQAKSDLVAERAVSRFGSSCVSSVLSWFDSSGLVSPSDLPDGWRRAIASQTAALLDWLAASKYVREASVALVADLTNPHSNEVHARGAGLWIKPPSEGEIAMPQIARVRFNVFLLALGFDNPPGGADELVARSFASVHFALSEDSLQYDSWALMEDLLPRLSWLRNWDKCERLRQGLAQRFVLNDWPVPQFFRCAQDRELLGQMLKSCTKVDDGDRFLKKIKQLLRNDALKLGNKEREVVESYI
jgi:hypothetical protein